ncbi:tpt-domain-containing protein [Zymoseptoria brevis]|uniref:Tpt-domain-containing protein n=1 Tax=Zymoseptoria brevis TaxID=1047168 RepID=A0A0F4G8D6_9PEZI|nr:tpt-domain-containing protein [Zymoseptoria brevis]
MNDEAKDDRRISFNSMHSDNTLSGTTRASSMEEAHRLLAKEEPRDIEAQHHFEHSSLPQTPTTPIEYSVSTNRKFLYLGLYFLLNLSVTLSNKALLKIASYPWLLTFSHTCATSIGCTILLATGHLKLSKLPLRDHLVLIAFSTLFTLNIAISNVSLNLVSVPFHQVMRSTCPIATILIYRLVYSRTYSHETYLSMVPLIIGVALATFGDYDFTLPGFTLTALGVLLASIKTVATNRLMTGSLKLSALEVLFRMSPLAAVQCLLYAAGSGELSRLQVTAADGLITRGLLSAAVLNASMAFGLNLVSFQTNKVAGALTISVCGNVKQCLSILLGIVLFNVRIGWVNAVGIVISVGGAAYYSKVELDIKRKTQATAAANGGR